MSGGEKNPMILVYHKKGKKKRGLLLQNSRFATATS
jgi:hypothetical protein